YKCPECGKSVRNKGNLVQHQKTHGRKKFHQCKVCERIFKKKISLIQHQRIHTGKRP
ncbi:Zinc finger protein 837, partial [Mesitornis unicolor]